MFNRTTSTLGALCPVEYPFHRSVIFSFAALFHGARPVEYLLDQDRVVLPKRYSTGENHPLSFLLLFSELGVLCPVEYPFHRSVIFSFTALFHGASPVEYLLDQDRVVHPKRYSTGRVIFSPIFPSSPNFSPFAPLRELSFLRFPKPKFNGK